MKYRHGIFAVLCIFLCIQCADEAYSPVYDLDFNDRISLDADLKVRFTDVDDQRCPVGVECLVEGYVAVFFELDMGSMEIIPLEMALPATPGYPSDTTLQGVRFVLLEVMPGPPMVSDTIPAEEFTVRLRVEDH